MPSPFAATLDALTTPADKPTKLLVSSIASSRPEIEYDPETESPYVVTLRFLPANTPTQRNAIARVHELEYARLQRLADDAARDGAENAAELQAAADAWKASA
jgi:hypothetical protein